MERLPCPLTDFGCRWGICCIHVYNIGGDTWFLDKARGIYHYIRSKDSVCGRGQKYCCDMDMEGGCYWTTKPDEGYLNSISTGLFAELCARLALVEGTHGGGDGRVGGGDQTERHPHLSKLRHILGGSDGTSQRKPGGDEYMESARCSLGWILRCVYRPNDAVVMDGLQTKKQTITNWTFTYVSQSGLLARSRPRGRAFRDLRRVPRSIIADPTCRCLSATSR